jgi:acetyl esterase/lipase
VRQVGALPIVMWIHGGGVLGDAKENITGYCKLIASQGFAIVTPRYTLRSEQRAVAHGQLMHALAYLETQATRLRIDPTRIVLAGDSTGAQLAAQLAAVVTTPGYARSLGVTPTITREQLRGVVLACGPYDLQLLHAAASTASGRRFVGALLSAYAGRRAVVAEPSAAALSVAHHITSAFPPALVTVGNADPLRRHSELLVSELRAHDVETETLLFPDDYRPPLGHEYQFDLDADAAQLFFARMIKFLERRLGRPPEPA